MPTVDEEILQVAQVHLRLLGSFAIEYNSGTSKVLTAKKAQALLAFTALQPHSSVAREKAAALLWPDAPDEFARTNLRQCLSVIRKTVPKEYGACLTTQNADIQLNREIVTSDTGQFEALLDQNTIKALEAAVKLYQGKLLDGFILEEQPFQVWLNHERNRLHERFITTLYRLIDHYHTNKDPENEANTAQQLLNADSLDEKAHRSLMHCYAASGRVTTAIRQYRICEHALEEKLGVRPHVDTISLFENLNDRSIRELNQGDKIIGDVPMNRIGSSSTSIDPLAGSDQETSKGKRTNFEVFSTSRSLNQFTSFKNLWRLKSGFWRFLIISTVLAVLTSWTFQAMETETIDDGEIQSDINPSKPSIAVLPFTNLTQDSLQTYFSDGLSEDLITDLSRLSGLKVIARASSFNYRNPSRSVVEIADELGVSYILQGSVRRINERVRINAQLVDIGTTSNIWANRYDREMSDVLQLQDEIAQTIANALSVKLTRDEQEILDRSLTVNPDAYDLLLRGLGPIRRLDKSGSEEARALFKRAISIDPDYARAYANLALSYGQDANFGFTDDPKTSIKLGFEAAERASQLDDSSPQLHFALSILHLGNSDQSAAIESAKRAIKADPNYADGYGTLAQAYMFDGQFVEASAAMNKAKQLNPQHTFAYQWVEGQIHFLTRQHKQSLSVLQQINERNPAFVSGRLLLISEYGHLGRIEEAEWEIAELLTLKPDFSIAQEKSVAMYRREQDLNYYLNGLRKAGLTD